MTVWGWSVGAWLEGNPSPSLPTWMRSPGRVTLMLLIVEGVGGVLLIINELMLRAAYFAQLEGHLAQVCIRRADRDHFDRARGRDLLALADLLIGCMNAVFGPLALALGLGFLYVGFGGRTMAAGLALLGAIGAALWLARLGMRLGRALIKAGEHRIGLVSRWLESGPWLLSWGVAQGSQAHIQEAARVESRWLNLDSLVKCTENQIGTFGLALPVLGALVTTWLTHGDLSGLISFAWAVVPFVGVVLTTSRAWSETAQATALLNSLRQGLPSEEAVEAEQGTVVVLDEAWDLFAATLARNLDPEGQAGPEVVWLVEALRLEPELRSQANQRAGSVLDLPIAGGGDNVSTGQKFRILAGRALILAARGSRRLRIEDSLACLDDEAVLRLRTATQHLGVVVTWSEVGRQRLAQVDAVGVQPPPAPSGVGPELAPATPTDAGPAGPTSGSAATNLMREVGSRIPALAWLYLLPAFALTGLSQLAGRADSLPPTTFAGLFLGLALAGFALAVGIGFAVERRLRATAVAWHGALLPMVRTLEAKDFFQRFTRDYQTLTGRLTWYLNDIAWIVATMAVSLIALLVGFRIVGFGLAAGAGLAGCLLWRWLAPAVVRARQETVPGINHFLSETENLKRLVGVPALAAAPLRRAYARSGMDQLWRTQAESIGSKTLLAYGIRMVEVATLALVVGIGPLLASEPQVLFMVAALLSVHHASSLLVQALAGFAAQKISLDRFQPPTGPSLPEPTEGPVGVGPRASLHWQGAYLQVSPITDTQAHLHFQAHLWPRGTVATLTGPSGSGKSRLLQAMARAPVSGLNGVPAPHRLLYFPKETAQHLVNGSLPEWPQALLALIAAQVVRGPSLVLLDEVFSEAPEVQAQAWTQAILANLAPTQGLLVQVDHRFVLGQGVAIEALRLGAAPPVESASEAASR